MKVLFPVINTAVLKRLGSIVSTEPAPRVVELPDTIAGRLKGLFCMDKPSVEHSTTNQLNGPHQK